MNNHHRTDSKRAVRHRHWGGLAALALMLLALWPIVAQAQQQAVVNRQRSFAKTVPAGNYSGIAWLGGNRYAVVNDKSPTAGFYLMTIDIDSLTGDVLQARMDTFLTNGQPNRDEEGICYVPQRQTVFVSGEADRQIVEYGLDGQLTGRRLQVPDIFHTAYKNGGFEALTYDTVAHRFWTTTEHTLTADGHKPTITNKESNRLRLQSFGDDLQPKEQYWYETDVTMVEKETGTSVLGVSGMAALGDGRLVVMEREVYKTNNNIGSFVQVKLYVVDTRGQQAGTLLEKQPLADFRTRINVTRRSFANYEGICLGPRLTDGRRVLLLIADSQNQYRGVLRDWLRTVVMP